MMKNIFYSIIFIITIFLGYIGLINQASTTIVSAQAPWELCSDGSSITRCVTYNCPSGDTDGDGTCTLTDNNSSITDARQDALCANPISGCGVVRYYNQNSGEMCSFRVKQEPSSCTLYTAGSPTFSPVPTASPIPTSTPSPTSAPTPTPQVNVETASCVNLVVEPVGGQAPVDLKFTVITNGQVEGYEFDFGDDLDGDSDIFKLTASTIVHRYETPGSYTAKVRVAPTTGNYEQSPSCGASVVIGGEVLSKGGERVERLPETGSEVYGVFALIIMGISGMYMYERFRVS